MSKKILAIYYSQSGQTGAIVDHFIAPFIAQGMPVEKVQIQLQKPFHFPWTSERFFDAMPESVLGKPVELAPFVLKEEKYDLIIFAYQPWYLSPSIPATSVLVHPAFRKVLKNTPVLTLIGARNMWINAQEKVKNALKEVGADLIGNVVLMDQNSNLISAVTILYWMLTGKKDRYLGVFPRPGVAEEDIEQASTFGAIALDALQHDNLENLQHQLVAAKALEVKPDLLFIEERGGRLFSIWANLVSKRKNRTFWLKLFKYYLVIALFIVAPIVLTVNKILFRPFFHKRIQRKKQYYLAVN